MNNEEPVWNVPKKPAPPKEASWDKRLAWWINYANDGCNSSFTIAHVLGKVPWQAMTKGAGLGFAPRHIRDFGRCHRLLELVPEFRSRLTEISDLHEEWKEIVPHWENVATLYDQEVTIDGVERWAGKCNALIRRLRKYDISGEKNDN